MGAPAVEVHDLSHRYGTRVALSGIDLTIQRGGLYAFLGPNGGGKTTFFRILCTLLRPSAGFARVLSLDVVREASSVRRHVGVVFQNPSLDGKLTVTENLVHHGHLYGLRGRPLRARTEEVLAQLGIADRAADRVEVLSGGLARRVELAKGLMHGPELLLLDEPSTGLDPAARRELCSHLRQPCDAAGVTVLLTTHITEEAEQCDRLAILDAGRLVAEGSPETLKHQIGGDCIAISSAHAATLSSSIAEQFGVRPQLVDRQVRIERDRGHELVPQLIETFGPQIDSITVSRPSLEDVFIHFAGHSLVRDDR